MTSAIRLDHFNKRILISKSFEKAAMNPTSDEYKDLLEIQTTHPEYNIQKRNIKANPKKETYAGLTYDYMKRYIVLHTNHEHIEEALAVFEEQLFISNCHRKSQRYPTIKKWFLTSYPEADDYGVDKILEASELLLLSEFGVA